MVADCDSERHAMIAGEYLTHIRKLPYIKISSSEGHYWLIVDFIGNFGEVIEEMAKIPGNDKQYIDFCKKYGDILLRAVTKTCIPPTFALDKIPLKSDVVIWWVNEYKKHFSSDIFKQAVYYRKLCEDAEKKPETKVSCY